MRIDDPAAGGSGDDADAAQGEPPITPRGVPAIDFRVDDFNWGDRRLGNVQATLSKWRTAWCSIS